MSKSASGHLGSFRDNPLARLCDQVSIIVHLIRDGAVVRHGLAGRLDPVLDDATHDQELAVDQPHDGSEGSGLGKAEPSRI